MHARCLLTVGSSPRWLLVLALFSQLVAKWWVWILLDIWSPVTDCILLQQVWLYAIWWIHWCCTWDGKPILILWQWIFWVLGPETMWHFLYDCSFLPLWPFPRYVCLGIPMLLHSSWVLHEVHRSSWLCLCYEVCFHLHLCLGILLAPRASTNLLDTICLRLVASIWFWWFLHMGCHFLFLWGWFQSQFCHWVLFDPLGYLLSYLFVVFPLQLVQHWYVLCFCSGL